MILRFLAFLSIFFPLYLFAKEKFALSFATEPKMITTAEPFNLVITLSFPSDYLPQLQTLTSSLKQQSGFFSPSFLVLKEQINTPSNGNRQKIQTIIYQIQPLEKGKIPILLSMDFKNISTIYNFVANPFYLVVENKNLVKRDLPSEILMPSLSPVPVEIDPKLKAQMLEELISEGHSLAFSKRVENTFGWLEIFLATVAAALLLYLDNMRRSRKAKISPSFTFNPTALALTQLDRLVSDPNFYNLSSKSFYSRLEAAIRLYLKGAFSHLAESLTSEEIAELTPDSPTLSQLLSACSLCKFGPPADSPERRNELVQETREFLSGHRR